MTLNLNILHQDHDRPIASALHPICALGNPMNVGLEFVEGLDRHFGIKVGAIGVEHHRERLAGDQKLDQLAACDRLETYAIAPRYPAPTAHFELQGGFVHG